MRLSGFRWPTYLSGRWFSARLLAILTEHGFSPSRLIVEVTENASRTCADQLIRGTANDVETASATSLAQILGKLHELVGRDFLPTIRESS